MTKYITIYEKYKLKIFYFSQLNITNYFMDFIGILFGLKLYI